MILPVAWLMKAPNPTVTGAGGAVAASGAQVASLEIAGVERKDVNVLVVDFLPRLVRARGALLDGIVGINVLRDFTVTIDYVESRVLLS